MTFLGMILAGLTVLYFRTNIFISLVLIATVGAVWMTAENTLAGSSWRYVDIFGLTCGVILLLVLAVPNVLRRNFISKYVLLWVRLRLPKMSSTEREAITAGDVEWDGELFSGMPRWHTLLSTPSATLTVEEKAFLDGPVEELCEMLDDWAITHEHYDLPQKVWQFMKGNRFFGLVIPTQYGGLGFSALAHSEVVMKISTRSISAAVTVMVPNSLGPAELLCHYGAPEQKDFYLPRLARGDEIPCFALTSALAGSDAGAICDEGVVCKDLWNGKNVLGLRITWNKRYITLAPVATLIGLAIKVVDPEQLLNRGVNLGVTCVLVPRDYAGVTLGARHLPMNTVFMNGPTSGENVFVPLTQVIGGPDMIGKGWSMLVECLSIGRSISLPALSTGAAKVTCLTTGAYASVRHQFGHSIAEFEGVQEALEPIAGYTYMMDAARRYTAGMLDRGINPAVPSAMLKYRNTELMRDVINRAMDVVAGRAVISGPRNFLARIYQANPISITVEGANILTRSLIIYGQGVVRCHPYLHQEIVAVEMESSGESQRAFDKVFFGHLAFAVSNMLRTLILGLSSGYLSAVPAQGRLEFYYRQLNRLSAAFALLTDVNIALLGGTLKERERLSGRMADCLMSMFFASTVIKRFHDDGYPAPLRPVVEWCLNNALRNTELKLKEVVDNYPVRVLRIPLRIWVFPLGMQIRMSNDALGKQLAMSIVQEGPIRKTLVDGVFVSKRGDDAVTRVVRAYQQAQVASGELNKLQTAMENDLESNLQELEILLPDERSQILQWAARERVLTADEITQLDSAMDAVYDALQVDVFDPEIIKKYRRSGLSEGVVNNSVAVKEGTY